MKPLRRVSFLFFSLLFCVRTLANVSAVTPVGEGTFSVTATASHKFTRNTTVLKEQATEAAMQYCAELGKQMKVVESKESRSFYLVGDFPSVTLTFKALAAGSPELNQGLPATAAPTAAPALTATAQLYTELTQLDELRQKGILTEEEFTAEKRKILARPR